MARVWVELKAARKRWKSLVRRGGADEGAEVGFDVGVRNIFGVLVGGA